MSLWLKTLRLKEELSPGRASLSFTFKNPLIGGLITPLLELHHRLPSTLATLEMLSGVERFHPPLAVLYLAVFVVSRHSEKQEMRGSWERCHILICFLCGKWNDARSQLNANAQTHARAANTHRPQHTLLHNRRRTHIPLPPIESWRGKKKKRKNAARKFHVGCWCGGDDSSCEIKRPFFSPMRGRSEAWKIRRALIGKVN